MVLFAVTGPYLSVCLSVLNNPKLVSECCLWSNDFSVLLTYSLGVGQGYAFCPFGCFYLYAVCLSVYLSVCLWIFLVCSMVYSLDPDTDPLGILLILDFYALRSGEYKFLIRLSDEWEVSHSCPQSLVSKSAQACLSCLKEKSIIRRVLAFCKACWRKTVSIRCSVRQA